MHRYLVTEDYREITELLHEVLKCANTLGGGVCASVGLCIPPAPASTNAPPKHQPDVFLENHRKN